MTTDTNNQDTRKPAEQIAPVAAGGREYAYCRVSTGDQTTENQSQSLRDKGFNIPEHRIVEETISGGVPAMERPKFKALVDRLEAGDRLVVLKLDRLGRDNIDVQQTISHLVEVKRVQLVCLDVPNFDLSSSASRLMIQLIASFAEFEKARIRERTLDGLARARAEGKKLGRPVADDTYQRVQACKARGLTQGKTATDLGVSISTVKRHWKEATE